MYRAVIFCTLNPKLFMYIHLMLPSDVRMLGSRGAMATELYVTENCKKVLLEEAMFVTESNSCIRCGKAEHLNAATAERKVLNELQMVSPSTTFIHWTGYGWLVWLVMDGQSLHSHPPPGRLWLNPFTAFILLLVMDRQSIHNLHPLGLLWLVPSRPSSFDWLRMISPSMTFILLTSYWWLVHPWPSSFWLVMDGLSIHDLHPFD